MNRRSFISLAAAAGFLATMPLSLVGCSTSTIATFVTTIGKYAASLATYFGGASIATQITSLAAQIATDVTNWQSGGAATDAINSLTDLAGIVDSIPVTAAFAPLTSLLLAAITGLLALLPSATAALAPRTARAYVHTFTPNHYKDASKKTMTQAQESFVKAWKAAVPADAEGKL